MTKLSCHWQNTHSSKEDKQWLAAWQPLHIKLFITDDNAPGMDVALRTLHPEGKIVMRHHPVSENYENRGIVDLEHARDMAHDHVSRLMSAWGIIRTRYPVAPEQLLWTGLNEPHIWPWGDEQPEHTAEYYKTFMKLMHAQGHNVMTLNIGVGWPGNEVEDGPPIWAPFDPVLQEFGDNDVLGLHEYWPREGPDFWWTWLGGRYLQCPWQVPIVIGECGIDDAAHPDRTEHYGWRGLDPNAEVAAEQYLGQLRWYDKELLKDNRILSAMMFTYDFSQPWATFSIKVREFMVRMLAYIVENPVVVPGYTQPPAPPTPDPVPEPPEPPTPMPSAVTVVTLDGGVRDLEWLSEIYGVTVDTGLNIEGDLNFKVVSLYEKQTSGHSHDAVSGYYAVKLVDIDNQPLEGWAVGRHWPGAPNGWPNVSAPENVTYPPEAVDSVVFGRTDNNGFVDWVAGPDDVCAPGEGANLFWCPSHQFGGDIVRGNGIFGNLTWVPIFQLTDGHATPLPTPVPEPEPEPTVWGNKYISPWRPLVSMYKEDIDERIIGTIIMIESAGKADAISPAGAIGLMQVMPKEEGFTGRPTHAELLDPATNILWGCKILRNNLVVYNDNLSRALAAYYGGSRLGNDLNDPDSIFYLNAFCEAWVEIWGTECPAAHNEPEILELINEAIRNLEDAKSKLAG